MKKITTVSENLTSWRWWAEWAGIFIGDAIMAAGFVFFINPYNIIHCHEHDVIPCLSRPGSA